MSQTHKLIIGNVIDVLKTIPNESIDLCVTSPPYFSLRDYGTNCSVIWGGVKECEHEWNNEKHSLHSGRGDCQKNGKYSEQEPVPDKSIISGFCYKCGAWKGQLGLEPTFQLYIQHLVEVFGEVKRVLKKSGSFYLNIGDSYSSHRSGKADFTASKYGVSQEREAVSDLPAKCLIGIPERLMLRLVDEHGWIRRNTLIWYKRNHMPSPIKDRRTNSYEPVYHFVKSQKYFYDLDSIRVPHTVCGVTDKRPKNVLRQRLYKGSRYNKSDDSHLTQYQGNFEGIGEDFESFGSPRARTQRKQDNVPGKNSSTYEGFNDRWKQNQNQYTVQKRNKEFIDSRNLPDLNELSNYLNENRKRCILTIDEVEKLMDSQAPHHWFNAESYPTTKDWLKIKDILKFDDKYDKDMTEVFLKLTEKQNHPLGKNPGDVMDVSPEVRPKCKLGVPSSFGYNHPNKNPERWFSDKGKNPGDFMDVTTHGYKEAHFAVYPEALITPFILSSCPKDICIKCGQSRIRITKQHKTNTRPALDILNAKSGTNLDPNKSLHKRDISIYRQVLTYETVGWSDCGCDAGWKAGVVLDPFGGSGTTAEVARDLGRNSICIEINPDYEKLWHNRLGTKSSLDIKYVVEKD